MFRFLIEVLFKGEIMLGLGMSLVCLSMVLLNIPGIKLGRTSSIVAGIICGVCFIGCIVIGVYDILFWMAVESNIKDLKK